MNSFIETLNYSGGTFLDFAWPIAWQSGLLIAALLAFDFLFRRQIRASVRYAVWLVVLVKLILPPTLALPTSPAWWLLHQPPVIQIQPQMQNYTVSYDDESLPPASLNPLPAYVPPKPAMTCAAWLLVLSAATSTGLLAWLLIRWWQITRRVSRAKTSERLTSIAAQTRLLAGVRAHPPVKLTADTMSPAVCGLFRPAILIPQTLAENFSDEQLRAVLLHELIHLRRRDVWLNFLQSLLQIVYWWHPLVWLANARIRRVREEAVDDAVMLALASGAEAYAPTLLQVAKLALNRPLVSLGLVGIMESRSALRQRIERLVDFRPPRRAGLTLVSIFGILAFTAVAVPMGGAPGATEEQVLPAPAVPVPAVAAPDTNRPPILIEAQIYQLRAVDFEKAVSGLKFNQSGPDNNSWWSASPAKFNQLSEDLRASGLKPVSRPRVLTRSGWPAEFYVGNNTNSLEFDCLPLMTNGLIELAGQGLAVAKSTSISITNQFSVKTVMEDRGGMVVRMNNADGSIESNVFMVTIGVQMVANTESSRYQQQLETIIKKKQPSADDVVNSASLVADAKLDYEMGKSEDAEKLLNAALAFDADNAAAKYYLGLINDARQHRQDGAQSVPGRPKFIEILNRTRLDQFVTKKRMPLEDVLSQLSQQAQQADPDMLGINIITAFITPDQARDTNSITIGPMNLKHVTLGEVLDAITVIADEPIKYSVMDNEIVFSDNKLITRSYPMDKAVFFEALQKQTGLPIIKAADASWAFRKYVSKSGVNLNLPPGKSVVYDDRLGQLIVRATESDWDAIDRAIQTLRQTAPSGQSGLQFSGPQEFFLPSPETFPPSPGMFTGIVSNPNFSKALHELQKRNADKELPEPEAVTRSGRYANWLGGVSIPLASESSAESSSQTTPAAHLYLRGFKVHTQTFLASLGLIPADFGENSPAVYPALRKFVTDLGVNWKSPAGKTISFDEKDGLLYVKATESDLDTIGRVLQAIPQAVPLQVHIKARFLEVPKGTFAGLAKVVNIPNQFNQLVGILTLENFQAALRNVEPLKGAEELAEPEAVTLSGRQTQMRATELITVITNFSLQENGTNAAFIPQTTRVEDGPMIDVIPHVLADGYTINLTAIASLTNFLGYDQPPDQHISRYDTSVHLPVILPVISVQQAIARLNLWDNQTLVLGNLPKHYYSGGKEVSAKSDETDKELIVFVTVTVVDPAGNRVHSEDEMPFAKTGIPPQPQIQEGMDLIIP